MASLDTITLLALDAFEHSANVQVVENYHKLPDGSHRHGAVITFAASLPEPTVHVLFVDFYHTVSCAREQIYRFASDVKKEVHHGQS